MSDWHRYVDPAYREDREALASLARGLFREGYGVSLGTAATQFYYRERCLLEPFDERGLYVSSYELGPFDIQAASWCILGASQSMLVPSSPVEGLVPESVSLYVASAVSEWGGYIRYIRRWLSRHMCVAALEALRTGEIYAREELSTGLWGCGWMDRCGQYEVLTRMKPQQAQDNLRFVLDWASAAEEALEAAREYVER